ncbi:MAG: permease [Bacteroidaceae bacterium]|nr:permease [Bacteroidaceae bacterium]
MNEILALVNEMSPYLLLGFLLAGLMHEFIPGGWYAKYLSGSNLKSVVCAAFFGVPLPLCSCGVIPTAMSLRKEGASRGATISFLIATPQTGVDSIIATYSLMGLPFAVIRPIVAMLTAVFGGALINIVDAPETEVAKVSHSAIETRNKSLVARLKDAFVYAYVEMMGDIGKWLVVGLVVAGLITVLVPDSFFEIFKDNSLMSMLLVLCLAVPMYICATGSIPIAVALMLKGLTPGAGLVLLMAGPACNMASLLVVGRVLGRRTLVTYLVSIILGAVGFGLAIDHLLPREWFVQGLMAQDACCAGEHTSLLGMGCSALLALLLVYALLVERLHDHNHEYIHTPGRDSELLVRIEGMDCSHCRDSARKVIAALPGVEGVDVDLASGIARVAGKVDVEDIRKALLSVGFSIII